MISLLARPFLLSVTTTLVIITISWCCTDAFTFTSTSSTQQPISQQNKNNRRRISSYSTSIFTASASSSGGEDSQQRQQESTRTPKTFREGEIMGLRLMQDGRPEDALKAFKQAMKLPGTKSDIKRTANVPGPSPVGGSKGGTEAQFTQTLDEFEYQAAHYNMACAYATLGNVGESVANLQKAFEYGFDNYATVRADPDLRNIHDTNDFRRLMDDVDPQRGFPNPFGAFGKK